MFHDSVEGHIRSLTSLGKSVDSYGDLLVSIILEKLPAETRKHLAREHSNSDWTLQELQDTILKKIRVLETMLPQSSRTPTASFYTGTRRVHTGDIPKKRSCIFCKGAHGPLAWKSSPSHRRGWRLFGNRICVIIALLIIKYHNAVPNTDAASVPESITPACVPIRVTLPHKATTLTRTKIPLVPTILQLPL